MKQKLFRSFLWATAMAIGLVPVVEAMAQAAYKPVLADQKNAPALPRTAVHIEKIKTQLEQPWGLEILADGRLLITEKSGQLWLYEKDMQARQLLLRVADVAAVGQGGLLDVAFVPGPTPYICMSYAQKREGEKNSTALMCGVWQDGPTARVVNPRTVWQQNPAWESLGHFGARIVVRGDGTLFLTTGDRFEPAARALVQNLDNSLGKVIRIYPDGRVPENNPFVHQPKALSEIWSVGHRNMQGAALDGEGRLWTLEHGPRGGDELNRPEAGKNYGWPIITYGLEYSGKKIGAGLVQKPGLEQPVYYWDPVIAPSGMVFYSGAAFPAWRGDVLIGGLVSQGLVRLKLQKDRVVGEERMDLDARIRDVAQGPDGLVYLITDAAPAEIIRLSPAKN